MKNMQLLNILNPTTAKKMKAEAMGKSQKEMTPGMDTTSFDQMMAAIEKNSTGKELAKKKNLLGKAIQNASIKVASLNNNPLIKMGEMEQAKANGQSDINKAAKKKGLFFKDSNAIALRKKELEGQGPKELTRTQKQVNLENEAWDKRKTIFAPGKSGEYTKTSTPVRMNGGQSEFGKMALDKAKLEAKLGVKSAKEKAQYPKFQHRSMFSNSLSNQEIQGSSNEAFQGSEQQMGQGQQNGQNELAQLLNSHITGGEGTAASQGVEKSIDISSMPIENRERLIESISRMMDLNRVHSENKLDVTFYHKELGNFKVQVQKGNAGHDSVQLKIHTDNHAARIFFESNEIHLIKSMAENGLRVEQFQTGIMAPVFSASSAENEGKNLFGEGTENQRHSEQNSEDRSSGQEDKDAERLRNYGIIYCTKKERKPYLLCPI